MNKPENETKRTPARPRTCVRCGQSIDTRTDSWELKTGEGENYATGIQHITCPPSPALQELPALVSPHQPVTAQPLPVPTGTPIFLSMDEAAKLIHVSKGTIRNRIRSGDLPAKRLRGGQTVLVEQSDVLALLEDISPGSV